VSSVWQIFNAQLQRRRRRWAWVQRWLPVPTLGAVGAVVGSVAAHHGFSVDAALPLWVLAGSWPVWRAPEEGAADALRFRLRVRRIGWRASVTVVLAFTVTRASGVSADWVLALAPIPALLEPLLWPLWPRSLRRAVRSAQVYEELVEAKFAQGRNRQSRNGRSRRRSWWIRRPYVGGRVGAVSVGFDPDRGVCGRPLPVESSEPEPEPEPEPESEPEPGAGGRAPVRATPVRQLLYLWREEETGPRIERWLRYASVSWSGRELLVTDGRQRLVRAGLAGRPKSEYPRPGERVLPHRPVELVWLTERRVDAARTYLESWVLLLDAEGRRLLTLPAVGLRQSDVGAVAHAAGLRFAAYELALGGWEGPRPLSSRLFPKRRGHIRLRFR